ncbi:MAG: EF-hand domain-containing protein [Pseudomonadota bacterium]
MSKRQSKKTETIEIRVSPELKDALSERASKAGRSMSEVVRGAIETQVAGSPQLSGVNPMLKSPLTRAAQLTLATIPAVALASVYLFSAQSPVSASAEIRSDFAFFDADADDAITQSEVIAALRGEDWEPVEACETGTADADEPCTIEAAAADHFGRADANGDGRVSFDEFEYVMLRDRAEDFLYLDLDESGQISLDEYAGVNLIELLDPEIAAIVLEEEGFQLSAECSAQLEAEEVSGLAAVCGVEQDLRAEMAIYDADRNGQVSLQEFLDH